MKTCSRVYLSNTKSWRNQSGLSPSLDKTDIVLSSFPAVIKSLMLVLIKSESIKCTVRTYHRLASVFCRNGCLCFPLWCFRLSQLPRSEKCDIDGRFCYLIFTYGHASTVRKSNIAILCDFYKLQFKVIFVWKHTSKK